MGIRWVSFITSKQPGVKSVFHFTFTSSLHPVGLVEGVEERSRREAPARRLAADAVDANPQSKPRPNDAPTMHFVQWEEGITRHFGRCTPRRKASYKAFKTTFSSTQPAHALFLRLSVNNKLLSLTVSQVCPLKARHVAQAFSRAANKRTLHTQKHTCLPPERDVQRPPPSLSSPSARRAAAQNLSGQGGEAALEKVPLALIRGDNAVRVRQRGADS